MDKRYPERDAHKKTTAQLQSLMDLKILDDEPTIVVELMKLYERLNNISRKSR